jgi:hypothetical protein
MLKRFINYFIIIYLFFLISLFSSWAVFHVYEGGANNFSIESQEKIKFYASIPGKIKVFIKNFLDGTLFDSEHTIIKNNYIKDGFTVYDTSLAFLDGLNLLVSSYDRETRSNEISLIDLDQKKIKHKWIIPDTLEMIRERFKSSRDYYHFRHPLLYDDTAIIVNAFPLGLNKPCLIKINKHGKVDWFIDNSHHSIEFDADQNIWVCGIKKPTQSYSYIQNNKIPLDAIFKIDPKKGKVLFSKSVFEIFHENQLDFLISIGQFEDDLFHINDIEPAMSSTKFWKKGDLLISLRHRNTILLFRPSTNKVIWVKTGPWSNQHDCDFLDDDKILVFGNDMIRFYNGVLINGYNNAYVYNLSTGLTEAPFIKIFKSSRIATIHEGRCDMLPLGNIFIEDTENGKIFFGDSIKVKITYSQRETKELIRGLHWSRIVRDNKWFP